MIPEIPISNDAVDPLKAKLHKIVFSDPLSETTKKAKRNLILLSFIGLIIGAYSVRIDSFLGFRIHNSSISDIVLNGMVATILLYFFLTYVLNLIIDLFAWNFKTEVVKVDPYIELLRQTTDHTQKLSQELGNVISNFENIYSKIPPQTDKDIKEIIRGTSQQIIGVKNSHDSFVQDHLPKILEEQKRIRNISRINLRIAARLLVLGGLEILLPISLCIMALYKTASGIGSFIGKILT